MIRLTVPITDSIVIFSFCKGAEEQDPKSSSVAVRNMIKKVDVLLADMANSFNGTSFSIIMG